LGDRTAVGGGARRLVSGDMRELMGAHNTRQKHKKLNSDITTHHIDRGDEHFERRWVVKY